MYKDLNENENQLLLWKYYQVGYIALGGIVGAREAEIHPISKFHSPYSFYSWPIWKT